MDELQTAWEAIRSGNLEQAQRIAAAVAKIDPDNADAWYLLSEAVEGQRQDLFRRKALALDPDVAARYEVTAGESTPAPELMGTAVEGEELSADLFPYPDNRPEVNIVEKEESEPEAAVAAATAPRTRSRRRGINSINLFLFLLALLILIVLYFFITSLL